jgi:hypothetical protein
VAKYSDVIDYLPRDGRVVVQCKDGHVVNVRKVYPDEHIASFNALIELAKLAGYSVVSPDGNKL